MRNVTIKRKKKFVASLSKVRIYIEDPFSSELTINDVPCRKIGELKNGEEGSFLVENREAKIFVIGDKVSKEFCSDYYQLPEGEEDIYLSGENRFSLSSGNAFRFDNNDTPEVQEARKKGKKKGRVLIIIGLIVGLAIGHIAGRLLFGDSKKEKVFSTNGLNITLTEDFQEVDPEELGYTAAFGSKRVIVLALKEPFTIFEGFTDLTVDDYLDLVLLSNSGRGAEKTKINGMDCIVYDYTNTETSQTFHYVAYPYKSNNSFWLVQFATLKNDAQKYTDKITKWAQSVSFY